MRRFADPLLIPFYGLAFVYFLVQPAGFPQMSETYILLKMAPIWYLIVYVSLIRHPPFTSTMERAYKNYFTLGLLISTVGDFFLASYSTLVRGILSFSVAHICYILGIWNRGIKAKYAWYLLPCQFVPLYLLLTSKVETYSLLLLLIFYSFVVFSTLLCAWCCHKNHMKTATLLAAVGATSFAISDSLIALDLWVVPIPQPQAFIMLTYYFAQLLFALSIY